MYECALPLSSLFRSFGSLSSPHHASSFERTLSSMYPLTAISLCSLAFLVCSSVRGCVYVCVVHWSQLSSRFRWLYFDFVWRTTLLFPVLCLARSFSLPQSFTQLVARLDSHRHVLFQLLALVLLAASLSFSTPVWGSLSPSPPCPAGSVACCICS